VTGAAGPLHFADKDALKTLLDEFKVSGSAQETLFAQLITSGHATLLDCVLKPAQAARFDAATAGNKRVDELGNPVG
jgi:hypothetical protein